MESLKNHIPRTDLALEARELISENNANNGLIIKEEDVKDVNIHITDITITNKSVAKSLGKRVGEYITIEARDLIYNEDEYHKRVTSEIKRSLVSIIDKNMKKLDNVDKGKNVTIQNCVMRKYNELDLANCEKLQKNINSNLNLQGNIITSDNNINDIECITNKNDIKKNIINENSINKSKVKILVAGLGNREATPDALGPMVVSNLKVTRHIEELGVNGGKSYYDGEYTLSAIAPDVMAKTGMETLEIIKGIVKITTPDIVLVVDSLAARDIKRLGKTIQITDTGIAPGSGVMNKRKEINEDVLGIPVIAIGVPMVIDAVTIVYDTMRRISDDEDAKVIEELVSDYMESMYVTPKDIDEYVKRISYTISEAINSLLSHKK